MIHTLRTIGILGIAIFGSLFSLTFASISIIEHSAKGFIKSEIEKQVNEKHHELKESSMVKKALGLSENLGFKIDKIQNDIDNKLPEKIAAIISSLCGYECEKKKRLAKSIADDYRKEIGAIKVAQQTLGDIIKNQYMSVVTKLLHDLRIFLGSNLAMFAILLSISLTKPNATRHLFFPGILLTISTIISSGIYIFGQNWFYTIIYNAYWGWGYLLLLSFIFGFMVDIALNKGRITTQIIKGLSNISITPC
jgi:hypothetical protein